LFCVLLPVVGGRRDSQSGRVMSGSSTSTNGRWSPWVAIVSVVGIVWLISHNEHSEAAKAPSPTLSQWLGECSPFESLDGMRALDFKISDNSVRISEAVDNERAAGAVSAKHPKIIRGTWSADEITKQVAVTLNAATIHYVLLITFSEEQ